MADRRAPGAFGVAQPPDIDAEYLEPWTPGALGRHLDLEDALVGADEDLSGVDQTEASLLRVRVSGTPMRTTRLRSLRMTDVEAQGVDGSNSDWRGARLWRVAFAGCRLTGLALVEAQISDVTFRDCKLDLATFAQASLERTSFVGCVFDEADFLGAQLRDVRFDGCRLQRVRLDGVRIDGVDLRGSDLRLDGDISALRGALIDGVQLVELAPLLADAAGILVRERQD